jgi:hypothetical protein
LLGNASSGRTFSAARSFWADNVSYLAKHFSSTTIQLHEFQGAGR